MKTSTIVKKVNTKASGGRPKALNKYKAGVDSETL